MHGTSRRGYVWWNGQSKECPFVSYFPTSMRYYRNCTQMQDWWRESHKSMPVVRFSSPSPTPLPSFPYLLLLPLYFSSYGNKKDKQSAGRLLKSNGYGTVNNHFVARNHLSVKCATGAWELKNRLCGTQGHFTHTHVERGKDREYFHSWSKPHFLSTIIHI